MALPKPETQVLGLVSGTRSVTRFLRSRLGRRKICNASPSEVAGIPPLHFNKSIFFFRIHNQHAILKLSDKKDKAFVRPCEKDCRILVNGAAITGEYTVH